MGGGKFTRGNVSVNAIGNRLCRLTLTVKLGELGITT